jgi:DtxR family transcriptional regulator, Mn-dependent transcriptional regulator
MVSRLKNSGEHYLVAIADLRSQFGYARVSDLARHLELTPGSVSITLKSLERKGLVERDSNGFLLLTRAGTRLAETTRAKNLQLQRFLQHFLGVSAQAAQDDSHRIDHVLSLDSARRLCALMRFVDSAHPAAGRFVKEFRRACRSSGGELSENCSVCSERCLLAAASD